MIFVFIFSWFFYIFWRSNLDVFKFNNNKKEEEEKVMICYWSRHENMHKSLICNAIVDLHSSSCRQTFSRSSAANKLFAKKWIKSKSTKKILLCSTRTTYAKCNNLQTFSVVTKVKIWNRNTKLAFLQVIQTNTLIACDESSVCHTIWSIWEYKKIVDDENLSLRKH